MDVQTGKVLGILILLSICAGCSVESVQCVNGKAYRFRPGETDLCPRFSIEDDTLFCYTEDNKTSILPKQPMTIVEYSKFQRKVGEDPFSGFISNECISSPISE